MIRDRNFYRFTGKFTGKTIPVNQNFTKFAIIWNEIEGKMV